MKRSALRFHAAARAELIEAHRYYWRRSPAAADGFLLELERALDEIAESPGRWPRYVAGTRRVVLPPTRRLAGGLVTTGVPDLTGRLEKAMRDARTAGLTEAADELEARLSAACTTSSEWLGEVGTAIVHFLRRERGRVPPEVQRQLEGCLAEVRKVWPDL